MFIIKMNIALFSAVVAESTAGTAKQSVYSP